MVIKQKFMFLVTVVENQVRMGGLRSMSMIVAVDWPYSWRFGRIGGGLWRYDFQFKVVLRRRMAGFMVVDYWGLWWWHKLTEKGDGLAVARVWGTRGLVFHTVAAGGDPEWKLVRFGHQRQASLADELTGGSHHKMVVN